MTPNRPQQASAQALTAPQCRHWQCGRAGGPATGSPRPGFAGMSSAPAASRPVPAACLYIMIWM